MAGCFEDSCGFRMNISNGAYVPEILESNLGTIICNVAGGNGGATEGLAVNLREQTAVDPSNADCNNILRRDTSGRLYANLPNARTTHVTGEYRGIPNVANDEPPAGDWSSYSSHFTYTNPFGCNCLIIIAGSHYVGIEIDNAATHRDSSINATGGDGVFSEGATNLIAFNCNINAQLLINSSPVNTSRFPFGGCMHYIGGPQYKKDTREVVHMLEVSAGTTFTVQDRARHEGIQQRLNVQAAGGDQNSGFISRYNILAIPLGYSNVNTATITSGTSSGGFGDV